MTDRSLHARSSSSIRSSSSELRFKKNAFIRVKRESKKRDRALRCAMNKAQRQLEGQAKGNPQLPAPLSSTCQGSSRANIPTARWTGTIRMGTGKGGKDKGGKGEDMGKDMGDKGEEVEAAWERATRLGDVNWDNWFALYLHERRQC